MFRFCMQIFSYLAFKRKAVSVARFSVNGGRRLGQVTDGNIFFCSKQVFKLYNGVKRDNLFITNFGFSEVKPIISHILYVSKYGQVSFIPKTFFEEWKKLHKTFVCLFALQDKNLLWPHRSRLTGQRSGWIQIFITILKILWIKYLSTEAVGGVHCEMEGKSVPKLYFSNL
jgi:hypothetical protein